MRPEVGSIWTHTKTGHEYKIDGFCVIEASLVEAVLYHRLDPPREIDREFRDAVWCRPVSEFLDGRFVPLPLEGRPTSSPPISKRKD